MTKNLLLFVFTFVSAFTFGQTTVEGSFEFDGETREYRLYVPAMYDETHSVPLVFNLHGYTSNNEQQEIYGDFRPIADTANFIIVHPQGLTDDLGITHWNTFGTSSVDDVGFLSALIDTIMENYSINHNRIYSTGMSNGGFMSYKLACHLYGRITAIASVTGSITVSELADCETNHPMPIMQIHGTADPTVGYEGSALFTPIDDLIDYWVNFNECSTDPIITDLPDIDTDDGCTVKHYLYEDGLLGSTVEFYKIDGGEHTWPGSVITTGITNHDFNASVEIWRFFSQYTLNSLTSGINEDAELSDFVVYPNPSNEEIINLNFTDANEKIIHVYNSLGELVLAKTISEQNTTIRLEEKGLFYITILSDDKIASQKIIRN